MNVGAIEERYLRSDTETCYATWLDAQFRSPADQLGLGTDPQFLVDVDQVALHSSLADKQVAGNLGCRQASRSQQRHLALTPTQRIHERRYEPRRSTPAVLTARGRTLSFQRTSKIKGEVVL